MAHNELASTEHHTQGSRTRAVLHRFLHQVRDSRKLHKHDKHTFMLTAAFLLAFFGFLRISEFTIPSRSRFNPQAHPTKASVLYKRKYFVCTIKASKTDQLHQGHKIYILRSHERFCPFSAMQKYLLLLSSLPCGKSIQRWQSSHQAQLPEASV